MARKLVGRRAAAKYVSLGEANFQAAVDRGEIPFHRDPLTKKVRYSLPALDEWLKRYGWDNVNEKAAS